MGKISELFVRIGANTKELDQALKDTQQNIQKTFSTAPIDDFKTSAGGLSSTIEGLASKFSALSAATALLGTYGLAQVKGLASTAGELHDLAEAYEISQDKIAEFKRAVEWAGGSVEQMGSAVLRLDKRLQGDSAEAQRAQAVIEALGVSLKKADGTFKDVSEQTYALKDALMKAKEAGLQQEAVLALFGSRGAALIPILNKMNDTLADSQAIIESGMEIDRLDELDHAFQRMDEQINQFKNSALLAFVPIAEDLVPPITEALKEATQFIAEHRKQLEETVVTVAKMIAAYEGVKIAIAALEGLKLVYATIAQAAAAFLRQIGILNAQEVASEETKQAALTEIQAKSLAKRMQLIDAAATRDEEREYIKIQKMKVAEEEKTRLFSEYCLKRETRALEEAERITAIMTEAYAKQNAAAAASATAQIAAQGQVAKSAATTSALMVGGFGKVGMALTAITLATTFLGTGFTDAGREANSAISQMESSCFSAQTAVEALTVAVIGLQAGWIGAAAALSSYLLLQAGRSTYADTQQGMKVGNEVYLRDKNGKVMRRVTNTEADSVSDLYEWVQETNADAIDAFNEQEEILFQEKRQADASKDINKSIQQVDTDMKKLLQDVLNADYGKASAAGSAGKSKSDKTYEVKLPIGDAVAELANSFEDGMQWMGEGVNFVTDNARIQCDSFTAALYRAAGALDDLPDNTVVNDNYFKAKGAYHQAGSGYTPQKGDLVVFDDHVGIYMGDNMIRSRQSSAGVTTISMQEAKNIWGEVDGYGSIAEASGNKTVTRTVDEATKHILDTQKKAYDAQERMNELAKTIFKESNAQGLGKYEQQLIALEDNVLKKQLKINEAKAEGANVEKVQQMLNLYNEQQRKRILDEQRKDLKKISDEAEITILEQTRQYEKAAGKRLEIIKEETEDEYNKRVKSLAHFMDIQEAEVIANKEKYAKLLKAENDYNDALIEAREKTLQEITKSGELSSIGAYFKDKDNLQNFVSDQDLKARQSMIEQYITWMRASTVGEMEIISNLSKTAYDSLSSNLSDFIMGTKSASQAFEDFGKSVLNMMSQIIAKALAAKLLGGIFGGLFGGSAGTSTSTSSYSIMSGGGFFDLPGFASGGIVTAPTLAMIGEGRDNEAVIPLNQQNLAALGGGNSKPNVQVNITNNTRDEVKVENTRYDEQLKTMVCDIVIDSASRNAGGFKNNLRAALA